MKQQSHVRSVRLDDTNEIVKLKITVGGGHQSSTTVYKNGNKIEDNPDYDGYTFDTKHNLIGNDFLITTSIHDLVETPNHVDASHLLTDSNNEISSSEFSIDIDEGEVSICSTQYFFLKK